jgi:predicted dehydrogenase
MYRIAILGCENSHADAFLSLIAEGRYPELEVVGVYSNEEEPPRLLREKYGVEILPAPTKAVGRVDGVMITARHGGLHSAYAAPYLASGIPMFIDKPITKETEDGLRLMAECKKRGIRLCGGSTCAHLPETKALSKAVKTREVGETLGGHLVCPIQGNSPYGGFSFYAQHLVDVMLAVFGKGIRRVRVEKSPQAWNMLADFKDFTVCGTWAEGAYYYSCSVLGKEGIRTEKLTLGKDCYAHEMDDMMALLRGEAMKKSYEDFILPVFVIHAAECAAQSGEWEEIPPIDLSEVV